MTTRDDEIALDVIELGAQAAVLERVAQAVEFDRRTLPDIQQHLISAFTRLAGQRFTPLHFEKPRDWWQAFKGRWFPRWARARWPVEMIIVDWTPTVVYPLIALPNEPRWELPYHRGTHERAVPPA